MKITKEEQKQAGIEEVIVNGMVMYRRKDRIFLTVEHAFYGDYSQERRVPVGRFEMDSRCKAVPYKQGDDVFRKIAHGQPLIALVKF